MCCVVDLLDVGLGVVEMEACGFGCGRGDKWRLGTKVFAEIGGMDI
jgi:hypothetical protein